MSILALCPSRGRPQAARETLASFEATRRDKGSRIVVELSGLSYIASAGVGVFINGLHKARAGGGSLQLATPSQSVREIFGILGLESVFTIHDSIEEAVAAAAK